MMRLEIANKLLKRRQRENGFESKIFPIDEETKRKSRLLDLARVAKVFHCL